MDIYFEPCYGNLYEAAENGKNTVWEYTGKEGIIRHQFLLREIPLQVLGQKWFDIITPYGYGGPVIADIHDGYTKDDLVQAFEREFYIYCEKNNIVSEFIRFHPVINNADDFKDVYHPECIRKTLGTTLTYEDPVVTEFSKSCRKNIRSALNKGISWRVTPSPDSIDVFKDIYYSTMSRNNAEEYYYFNDEYFSNCLKWFNQHILFVEAIFEEKTIAAGLYFIYGDTIHIHLSGTLSEYLYLSPAYILRYAATLWGKENGYKLIHHGGGKSNAADDSLFLFKKQFAQTTSFDFYVGKKIWNEAGYEKLCKASNNDKNSEFFPAYRNHR